jgi:hypothetical protein
VLGLRARELHGAIERLAEGWMGVGWSGWSMVVEARAAADTPCAERTPAMLRLGGAESEWGCTVMALVGFIGAGVGVGVGSGVERHGRVEPSARACSGMPGQVEHVFVSFCLSSSAC